MILNADERDSRWGVRGFNNNCVVGIQVHCDTGFFDRQCCICDRILPVAVNSLCLVVQFPDF